MERNEQETEQNFSKRAVNEAFELGRNRALVGGDSRMSTPGIMGTGPNPGTFIHEPLTLENIEDAMRYQPWDREQTECGDRVREMLLLAAKAILRHVPSSPRRTLALQHLISARMDANAAISFRGRF